MSWTPDPSSTLQLVQIFAGTLSSDTNIRQNATTALSEAKKILDFDNYLLHILLANDDLSIEDSTRASAGIYLKNDLVKNFKYKDHALQLHILQLLPHGLLSESSFIRKITSTIISAIFRAVGNHGWPSLIQDLISLLNGAAGQLAIDGASQALASICEDSSRILDYEVQINGNTIVPMQLLIPQLIQSINNTSLSFKIRSNCMKCLVYSTNTGSNSIYTNLDNILNTTFTLCSSDNEEIQKQISLIFISILEQWPDKLYVHWNGIVSWCIHMISSNNDETVSLNAAEFILAMSTNELPSELVLPYLKDIIPLMLLKMVYDETDVEQMELEDSKDDGAEDKDEDIKPQIAKSKEHKLSLKKDNLNENTTNTNNNNDDDDSDDDDDDEDDENDDEDFNYTWNLRKCSAATVDILSTSYPEQVLEYSFPIIKNNMNAIEWPIREASILTLGAISEAALNHATPQLPELVPFLVERLKDDQPRVRQITCWTLGRYSSWVCMEANENGAFSNYFTPTFQSIMDCALDKKKVVQESACSSLADFIQSSEAHLLEPFIEPLLNHFQVYFANYRRKNLIVLYDTIQTFVEKLGENLKYNPNYLDLLLPPLIQKWQNLDDNDKDLWPLLECMSSVAASIGEGFANCSLPVYQRAMRILHNCIEQEKLSLNDPSFIPPEKDFIVSSLDLIDGLIQGLASNSTAFIASNESNQQYSLMELILTCLDDDFDDVRQSSYALIGDIAIYLFDSLIKPFIQPLMINIYQEIGKLNHNSIASCNNAIWALGEIAIRSDSNLLDQYLVNFFKILEPIIHDLNADTTLLENVAITIGRFGINYPIQTSQIAQEVLIMWCELIQNLEDNEEKESAVNGMCNIILKTPQIANDLGNIHAIIDLIKNYYHPSVELAEVFKMLLVGFKSGLGPEWDRMVGVSNVLQRYGV